MAIVRKPYKAKLPTDEAMGATYGKAAVTPEIPAETAEVTRGAKANINK